MGTVDFDVFDADNHYYEATDAFIRHLPKHRSKLVQWAEIDGKQRMIVDNKIFRFIPNPTFDPVARPGCLDDYFRGKQAGDDIRAAFGELEPISPAYREPEPRVKLMDTQGMQACFMFPTLGVGVEEALLHDPAALHDVFHGFNEWMLDDWTFNYSDRIYAAPYIALQDPERAEQRGCLRAGERRTPGRDAFRPGARPRFLAQSRRPGVRPHVGPARGGGSARRRTTRATRATTATPTSGAAAATSRRSATTRSATSPVGTVRSTTPSPRSRATACSAGTRTCVSRRSRAAPSGSGSC